MTPTAKPRRFTAGRVVLFTEAMVLILLAAPAIRLLPFRRLGKLASWRKASARHDKSHVTTDAVSWAVQAAARRSPFRALCFEQGLVAQVMLRRRGVPSTLYFGAAPGKDRPLEAHVWVKVGAVDVAGTENAHEFATLARFPSED